LTRVCAKHAGAVFASAALARNVGCKILAVGFVHPELKAAREPPWKNHSMSL
jgi:hypothetical protein